MSPAEGREPSASEVLGALGEAASQLGSFVSHMLDEQPGTALLAALAAGFIAGGGLASPLGTRVTATTVRATLGNLATLVALDLFRRALEDGGGSSASPASPGTE
jgi:uncharacterized membrane protein YfcA